MLVSCLANFSRLSRFPFFSVVDRSCVLVADQGTSAGRDIAVERESAVMREGGSVRRELLFLMSVSVCVFGCVSESAVSPRPQ